MPPVFAGTLSTLSQPCFIHTKMSYPHSNNASWALQPPDAQQYPAAQHSAPPGYPGAQPQAHPPPAPVQHYPMAAPVGDPAAAWQLPTGCGQASSSSTTVDGPHWPQQQQQQQQYVEQQSPGAVGPDGSRGLGSTLLGAGHKVMMGLKGFSCLVTPRLLPAESQQNPSQQQQQLQASSPPLLNLLTPCAGLRPLLTARCTRLSWRCTT